MTESGPCTVIGLLRLDFRFHCLPDELLTQLTSCGTDSRTGAP